MSPHRAIDYLTKAQTMEGNLLFFVDQRSSKDAPKQNGLLPLALVASQNLEVSPWDWRYHALQTRELEVSRGNWAESLIYLSVQALEGEKKSVV